MIRLATLAAGCFLLNGIAFAASPNPDSLIISTESVTRAHGLIRQLGSDTYRDREKATRELRQMGRLALPALAKTLTVEADPEVRTRCEWLLPLAEADDMAARVAAFLADTDGKFTHDLPGWNRYRDVAGSDAPARALFAEMVKNRDNHELLLAIRHSAEELGRSIASRRLNIQMQISPPFPVPGRQQSIMPTLPDIATLLLAETLVPERLAPIGGYQYHVSNFFYQPQGRDAVNGNGRFGPSFRKLAINWLDTRDGPNGAMTAMNLAQNLGLGAAEVSKHAARSLTVAGMHPWNKANALGMIARNQSKEHLPAMIKAFTDETALVRGVPNAQPDIQVRDAALAMTLILTEQDPKAYGMNLQVPEAAAKFNPTAHAFRDEAGLSADDKRTAAFKKWEKWAETNLKDGKLKTQP